MRTGEQRLWDAFRPLVVELDPQRIESPTTGGGIPDVSLANCWVELKYMPKWPARATTPLRIDHFTVDQRNWHRARRRAGGRSYVLLKVGKNDWLLFDGAVAAMHLGFCTQIMLATYTLARWTRSPTKEEIQRWLA